VDSALLSSLFTTRAMREVLGDESRIDAMLAFEAALARAEADAGIIPPDAAEAIEAACRSFTADTRALAAATRTAGNPAIPLVKALTAHCAEPGRGWVHWGATSQDVIDTATSLVGRRAVALLDSELIRLCDGLAALALAHRDTVMPGRTLLQPALPITLGFKAAQWLDMTMRCRERLGAAAADACLLQFGGAVGTLAALGVAAATVRERLGQLLELPVPHLAWHTSRDRIARLGCEVAVLTGTLAKIAGDVALLMQAEIAEAFEPAAPGKGGSSTMPQKRNPVAAPAVRAAALRANGLAADLISALPQEHERGAGGWHMEWTVLPDLLLGAAGALSHVGEVIEGLEVDPARMRANLETGGGTLMSEALMMALAPRLGRLEAHRLVADLARRTITGGPTLRRLAEQDETVLAVLGREGIAEAFRPEAYLGVAGASIDEAVARWTRRRD
jgi:3-carboxy-cis,cis-muconate cycloisomerase